MKMERIQTLETMKYNTCTNKTVIRDHILISKNFIPMKITASTVQQQSYSLSNQTCKIYMQQVNVLITLYYICLIAIYFKHLIGKLFNLPKRSIIRTLFSRNLIFSDFQKTIHAIPNTNASSQNTFLNQFIASLYSQPISSVIIFN